MPGFRQKAAGGRESTFKRPGFKGNLGKKKAAASKSVRAQIRDLKRLLQKGHLPTKASQELNAKLETLTQEHDKRQLATREQKMSQRYHKIKFFERRKLERRISMLEKRLAAAAAGAPDNMLDPAVVKQRLHQCQEDLQYVLFFPPAEKYVSIIKNPLDLEDPARQMLLAERKRLRALAFARRADQAMVTEADEGAGLLGLRQTESGQDFMQGEQEEDDFFLQDSSQDAGPDASAADMSQDATGTLITPEDPSSGSGSRPQQTGAATRKRQRDSEDHVAQSHAVGKARPAAAEGWQRPADEKEQQRDERSASLGLPSADAASAQLPGREISTGCTAPSPSGASSLQGDLAPKPTGSSIPQDLMAPESRKLSPSSSNALHATPPSATLQADLPQQVRRPVRLALDDVFFDDTSDSGDEQQQQQHERAGRRDAPEVHELDMQSKKRRLGSAPPHTVAAKHADRDIDSTSRPYAVSEMTAASRPPHSKPVIARQGSREGGVAPAALAGEPLAGGSRARLARLQAFAAAMQRKHQLPQHAWPNGMPQHKLLHAALPSSSHGPPQQPGPPRPVEGRNRQHAKSKPGRKELSKAGKAAHANSLPVGSHGGRPHPHSPVKQAGADGSSQNAAVGNGKAAERQHAPAGQVAASQGQAKAAAAPRDTAAADDAHGKGKEAAPHRTRAEGGRKRRKKK